MSRIYESNISTTWHSIDRFVCVILVLGLIQGACMTVLEPLVTERSFFLFRLTPWNIYPSDLVLVPILVGYGFLVRSVNYDSVGFGNLLVAWWAICAMGLAWGYLNDTALLIDDVKYYFLRSGAALGAYWLGCHVQDWQRILNLVANVSVVIGAYYILEGAARLALGGPLLMGPSYRGCHALALPLAILISDLLIGGSNIRGPRVTKVVIILSGIVLSLSKPVVAGALICIAAAFLASPASIQSSKSGQFFKFLGLAVVLAAVFVLVILNNDSAMQHFQREYLKKGVGGELSGGRFGMWSHSLRETMNESPVFGHGMGHYVTMKMQSVNTGKTISINSLDHHNQVVKFIDQIGFFGLAVVIVLIVAWYKKTKRLIDYLGRVGGVNQLAAISFFAFAISVFGISCFGNGIRMPTVGFLFWTSLGLIPAVMASSENSSFRNLH